MSGYFKELFSGTKSLFIGLGITGKYFLEPVVTLQYPHEHLEMTPRYRGHIELIPNEKTGEPKCIVCGMCEKGLPVADMLRFLSYAEGYGQFAMARERYLELPRDVRQIRCRDCYSCSVDCVNGVEVRNRLIHAQALLA